MENFKRSFWILVSSLTIDTVAAFATCQSSELRFRWPLDGVEATDWVINNYVDLDPAVGAMRDYQNNTADRARTYDNHRGVDIDISTFRNMDAGTRVFAAAAGEVVSVREDLFDRNMESKPGCGDWNHVAIRHANGFVSYYGHLKRDSVVVAEHDVVAEGQFLGLVGSSGCSTQAHLHFEVHDCTGGTVDPFNEGMFIARPNYDIPLTLMDMAVRKGHFPEGFNDALMKDPQPNINSISRGARVGVGLSLAGGSRLDRVEVEIVRPDDTIYTRFQSILDSAKRHTFPRWWFNLPPNSTNTWRVNVRINNRIVRTHNFGITDSILDTTYGMLDASFEQNLASMTDDGYSTVYVDGSESPDGARLSAIYRRDNQQAQIRAFHNQNDAYFRQLFREQTIHGRQIISLDSYVRNGQLNVAGAFAPRFSTSRVEHFLTREDHQRVFDEVTRLGFVPYSISVSVLNGVHYYTSFYMKESSRGFVALADLNEADYQAEFNRQKAAGLGLVYIDVYDNGAGVPLFSAIWHRSADPIRRRVRHNMTEAMFFGNTEAWYWEGFRPQAITSYLVNGERRYAGFWVR